jgi:hypothetical protein
VTAASLAYLISVLFISWAAVGLQTRAAYSCPTCGSKRADGHSSECPWSSRP